MKEESNENKYVQTSNPVNSVTGTKTLLPANQFNQTIWPSQNSMAMEMESTKHMQIQTIYPPQNSMGTETSIYRDRNVQMN